MEMEITQDEKIMAFAATCIEETAEKLNKDYEEVLNLFDNNNIIDNYIVKHYEVLHTMSRNHIVEDLIEILNTKNIPNPV